MSDNAEFDVRIKLHFEEWAKAYKYDILCDGDGDYVIESTRKAFNAFRCGYVCLADTGPIKSTLKRSRETESQSSDRIPLIEQANEFVGHITSKQYMPMLGSGAFSGEVELDSVEKAAYHSALKFLTRQFDDGYRDLEVVDKKVDSEESFEYRVS